MIDFLASLRALVDDVKQRPLTGMEKRQADEADKSESVLREALSIPNNVSAQMQESLVNLGGAFQRSDWGEAKRLQMELTSLGWSKHKSWLKGIKYLIGLARRAR